MLALVEQAQRGVGGLDGFPQPGVRVVERVEQVGGALLLVGQAVLRVGGDALQVAFRHQIAVQDQAEDDDQQDQCPRRAENLADRQPGHSSVLRRLGEEGLQL